MAVDYAVAGTVGNLIVRSAIALAPIVRPAARQAVVAGLAGGILGSRRVLRVGEHARLKAGDLLAEAYQRLGEQAPVPSAAGGDGHDDHQH
jgi:hypothetical protein